MSACERHLPPVLAEYLGLAARQPFVWGEQDCMLFAANWVRLCTGNDPAIGHRGNYRGQKAAEVRIARGGGLAGLAARGCKRAGLMEVTPAEASHGDVCLARLHEAGEQAAAIITDVSVRDGRCNVAILRANGGLYLGPAFLVRVWKVPQ